MHAVLDAGARIAEHVPVVLMCYANPLFARGPERFAARARRARISGLIVPDLPLEESAAVLAACDAEGVALVPLVAPTTPDARLAADRTECAWICLHGLGRRDDRRAGAVRQPTWPALLARVKAHSPVPVAAGFGISTGAQAAAAADAGADGVIVGSRLVRAVAEAAERGRGSRPPRPLPWSPSLPPPWSASLRAGMGLLLTLIAGLVIWVVLWGTSA